MNAWRRVEFVDVISPMQYETAGPNKTIPFLVDLSV